MPAYGPKVWPGGLKFTLPAPRWPLRGWIHAVDASRAQRYEGGIELSVVLEIQQLPKIPVGEAFTPAHAFPAERVIQGDVVTVEPSVAIGVILEATLSGVPEPLCRVGHGFLIRTCSRFRTQVPSRRRPTLLVRQTGHSGAFSSSPSPRRRCPFRCCWRRQPPR